MAIHALEQELLERAIVVAHLVGKGHDRPAQRADIVDRSAFASARRRRVSAIRSLTMRSIRRRIDSWMSRGFLDPGVARRDLAKDRPDQRHVVEIGDGEQPGAQPVVDVVIVVGDVVGERRHLRLGARARSSSSSVAAVVVGDRRRHRRSIAGRAAARCA